SLLESTPISRAASGANPPLTSSATTGARWDASTRRPSPSRGIPIPVDPYTSVTRPGWSRSIATPYRTCLRYARRPLELVDGLRPVVLQQARQRPVGQETAPGLAGGAVVRLVVGVDDPLHRRSAPWARLAVLAVHRHVGP